MSDIEKRARELLRRALPFLADEAINYEDDGSNEPLELSRDIVQLLSAIPANDDCAAMTIPEGYVLVPQLPTYAMAEAMGVKWESGDGFPWRYAAMLAARPEVG